MAIELSPQNVADAIAAKAPIAAYGGSAVAIFGGVNDWNMVATIGGILIGLGTLAVTIFYKRRHDKREQVEHELRMALRGSMLAHRDD